MYSFQTLIKLLAKSQSRRSSHKNETDRSRSLSKSAGPPITRPSYEQSNNVSDVHDDNTMGVAMVYDDENINGGI